MKKATYLALLQALAAGGSGEVTPEMLEALGGEQSEEGQRLRLLSRLWTRQESETAAEPRNAPGPPAVDEPGEDRDRPVFQQRRRGSRIRKILETMRARLDELEEDNAALEDELRAIRETFARALGMCRQCGGAEPSCDVCGGKGSAGYFPPDRRLYRELVEPAVRRMEGAAVRPFRPRDTKSEASSEKPIPEEKGDDHG